jgi:hypothetical protein
MHDLQTRTLPRLMMDTVHCLWVAHDHLPGDLRNEARLMIIALRKTDTTDIIQVASTLRDTADHLARVESELEAMNRPLTAKKVQGVRDRVQHLTAFQNCG